MTTLLSVKALQWIKRLAPFLGNFAYGNRLLTHILKTDDYRTYLCQGNTRLPPTIDDSLAREAIRNYFEIWLPVSWGEIDAESRPYTPYKFEGALARAKHHFAKYPAGLAVLDKVPLPTADDPQHMWLIDKTGVDLSEATRTPGLAKTLYRIWADDEASADDPEAVALWKTGFVPRDLSAMVAEEWVGRAVPYFSSPPP